VNEAVAGQQHDGGAPPAVSADRLEQLAQQLQAGSPEALDLLMAALLLTEADFQHHTMQLLSDDQWCPSNDLSRVQEHMMQYSGVWRAVVGSLKDRSARRKLTAAIHEAESTEGLAGKGLARMVQVAMSILLAVLSNWAKPPIEDEKASEAASRLAKVVHDATFLSTAIMQAFSWMQRHSRASFLQPSTAATHNTSAQSPFNPSTDASTDRSTVPAGPITDSSTTATGHADKTSKRRQQQATTH
jgi:hypothetical protein